MNQKTKSSSLAAKKSEKTDIIKQSLKEAGRIAGNALIGGIFFALGQGCYSAASKALTGSKKGNVVPLKRVS